MACTASYKKRKDLEYVKIMAGHQANIEQRNMQVYKETMAGVGVLYNFEEEKEGRPYVVAVVKFRKHKSKRVLQNSGNKQQKSAEPKPEKKGKGRNTK